MSSFNFVSKKLIEKGWSKDKKYLVETQDGEKYLLRVSPFDQYERKKNQYELSKRVGELGIPMCQSLEFGVNEEGVYTVQSWIDGYDAESVIPALTSEEQYRYGFEAGQILKKIHQIPAPNELEDWESYFNRNMDRKLKAYEECGLKYENGEVFVKYISSHRHLLANRPRTYQHGDFHIGNMMIGKDKGLYIIDFDKDDFGDPWEEFNRIVWCAQANPTFATGIVNGYFDGAVPVEFWELLALYISSNTLSSLPWAIPFGKGEVQTMINQAKNVLSWYDNMKNPVPSWYQGSHKIFGEKKDASYLDRKGAYLIPIKDGKVAVVKTPKGYFLLGGGIDEGECDEQALVRECLEEIGYTIRIEKRLCSAETYTIHSSLGYFHPIQVYYLGELVERIQTPVESDHELVWLEHEVARDQMFAKMQGWAIDVAVKSTK